MIYVEQVAVGNSILLEIDRCKCTDQYALKSCRLDFRLCGACARTRAIAGSLFLQALRFCFEIVLALSGK